MQHQSIVFTNPFAGATQTPFPQWLDGAHQNPPQLDQPRGLGQPVPLPIASEWHTSDEPSTPSTPSSDLYPSSPSSPSIPPSSPSSSRASSPATSFGAGSPLHRRRTVSRRSARDPSHIPRPRNAFILYRSKKCKEITLDERDHRILSQIFGTLWKKESTEVRQYYQGLAAAEKAHHKRMYPNYRFNPQQRKSPPKRRNVKRNGDIDKKRCLLVAELLRDGKDGEDLKAEIDKFDQAVRAEVASQAPIASSSQVSSDYTTDVFDSRTWSTQVPHLDFGSSSEESSSDETPAFRSPLLPPAPLALKVSVPCAESPLSPLQFATSSQASPAALPELNELAPAPSGEYVNVDLAYRFEGSLALAHMYPDPQYGPMPAAQWSTALYPPIQPQPQPSAAELAYSMYLAPQAPPTEEERQQLAAAEAFFKGLSYGQPSLEQAALVNMNAAAQDARGWQYVPSGAMDPMQIDQHAFGEHVRWEC